MLHLSRFCLMALFATLCLPCACPSEAQNAKVLRPISEAPSFVKRALVIGVGKYVKARSLAPATYNDARRFAQLLKTHFKFDDNAITLMTDAPGTPEELRPTYLNLTSAIDTLLEGLTDQSEVIVYFSGHGIRSNNSDWLVPLDGLPNNVSKSCIDYDDFKKRLTTKLPARALLIIDACRNLQDGKDGTSSGFGASKGLSAPQFAELLSCRPKEISQLGRPEDFSESVFTHYLLEGLSGATEAQEMGKVTFDSLNQFVQGKVSQYVASKFGSPQNPDGRASLGKMVLARGSTPPPPPNSNAFLRVETTPSGASILLDGVDTGWVTPADITVPVTGGEQTFKLELVLKGYDLVSKPDLTLESGKRRTVQERLHKSPPISPANSALKEIEHKTGLKLLKIPGGSFDMGSDKFLIEKPIHRVRLDSYWMSENVVTVAQFRKFAESQGYSYDWKKWEPSWGWLDTHPMVNVTWDDAMAYCSWAGVSLPREAEWEYASRGGLQGEEYPWQGGWDAKPGNLHLNGKGTSPVGTFFKNGYGLYDMSGNVCQWCSDWFDIDYYKTSPEANPQGPATGAYRIQRGVWWNGIYPSVLRCANRMRDFLPGDRSVSSGFRVVFRGLP